MIKSMKKTLIAGVTAAIIGIGFAPISGAEASTYLNASNNVVKVNNHGVKIDNHHYTHLKGYSQTQINKYNLRFKQLDYNIYNQQSIMKFQRNYRLHADGIVGKATIAKLMLITYSQSEVDLLARTIYMQSYNQPFNAQVGVGAVILNRLQYSQFPNSIYGVIRNDRHFKEVMFGKYADKKPEARYYRAAYKAIQGIDPTRNALYVQNNRNIKATSSISLTEKGIVTYGQTVFTR